MALVFQISPMGLVPLKAAEKAAEILVEKVISEGQKTIIALDNGKLNELTGGYANSCKCLARYLQNTGKPLAIDFSSEQWKKLVALSDKGRWERKKDGWNTQAGINTAKVSSDVWGCLGTTRLEWRQIENGAKEYRAVEEYNFTGSDTSNDDQYSQTVPKLVAKIAKLLFPDFVDAKASKKNGWKELSVDAEWLRGIGKPFRIDASMKMDKDGNVYEINGKKVVKL